MCSIFYIGGKLKKNTSAVKGTKDNKNVIGLVFGITFIVLVSVLIMFTGTIKSNQGQVHPLLDLLLLFIPSLITGIVYSVYRIMLYAVGVLGFISIGVSIYPKTRHSIGIALTIIGIVLYALVLRMILTGEFDIDFVLWRNSENMI